MKITVLTFAQTRAQLGFSEKTFECEPDETPRQILHRLAPQFQPGKTIRVAVNQEYADWDTPVGNAIELREPLESLASRNVPGHNNSVHR